MTDEPRARSRPMDAQSKAGGPPVLRKHEGKEDEPEAKDDAKPAAEPHFVGTGMFWGLVVGILLAVVIIGFAAQNTQSATVKTIVWEWSAPIFVVVLISLIVGIVLDEIVGLLFRSRRRRRLAEQAELHRLRSKN